MRLTSRQRQLLDDLAGSAAPLVGMFFRSVEFRWMHPDDVMSGMGASRLGGRFVAIGAKAVYASDSEETLLQEISTRKARLGGRSSIATDKYPRVTFRIDLKVDRFVSFADPFPRKDLQNLRQQCLKVDDLAASQIVGRYLADAGVQAVLYPSVAGDGKNVVVFIENTRRGQVSLFNRERVINQIARLRTV